MPSREPGSGTPCSRWVRLAHSPMLKAAVPAAVQERGQGCPRSGVGSFGAARAPGSAAGEIRATGRSIPPRWQLDSAAGSGVQHVHLPSP